MDDHKRIKLITWNQNHLIILFHTCIIMYYYGLNTIKPADCLVLGDSIIWTSGPLPLEFVKINSSLMGHELWLRHNLRVHRVWMFLSKWFSTELFSNLLGCDVWLELGLETRIQDFLDCKFDLKAATVTSILSKRIRSMY